MKLLSLKLREEIFKEAGLQRNCDVLVDQIRAIANRRFRKPPGALPHSKRATLIENLKAVILE